MSYDRWLHRGQLNVGNGERTLCEQGALSGILQEAFGHLNTIQQARLPEEEDAHGDATMRVATIACLIHEKLTGVRLSPITTFKLMLDKERT